MLLVCAVCGTAGMMAVILAVLVTVMVTVMVAVHLNATYPIRLVDLTGSSGMIADGEDEQTLVMV